MISLRNLVQKFYLGVINMFLSIILAIKSRNAELLMFLYENFKSNIDGETSKMK